MSGTTLRALWLSARAQLAALPKDEAERDARLLIQAAFRLTPAGFTADLGRIVPEGDPCKDHLDWMLSKRAQRMPVSHILREAVFWGRTFEVTSATLAPRGDTESLLAEALSVPFDTLLDLGTGTGCLGISLLAERKAAQGIATDISVEALAVAGRNAVRHGVEARLSCIQSDWLAQVTGTFDLIVSNPPYITEAAFATLAPEVREYEPKTALTPGGDGLEPYRILCAQTPSYLVPGGWLMVEIGYDQGPAVAALMEGAGLQRVTVVADLSGHDRVVRGQRAPLAL